VNVTANQEEEKANELTDTHTVGRKTAAEYTNERNEPTTTLFLQNHEREHTGAGTTSIQQRERQIRIVPHHTRTRRHKSDQTQTKNSLSSKQPWKHEIE
jgi:hypothetical protein